MLKLCQNCVAYVRADDAGLDKCSKVPLDLNTQYVRDEPPVFSYCTSQRGRIGSCGPEGKLYQELPLEQQQLQVWRSSENLKDIAQELAKATPNLGVDTAVETPHG